MNMPDKKEFWLFADGKGCADPDYLAVEPDPTLAKEFIHVISADWVEAEIADLETKLIDFNKVLQSEIGQSEAKSKIIFEQITEIEKLNKILNDHLVAVKGILALK